MLKVVEMRQHDSCACGSSWLQNPRLVISIGPGGAIEDRWTAAYRSQSKCRPKTSLSYFVSNAALIVDNLVTPIILRISSFRGRATHRTSGGP